MTPTLYISHPYSADTDRERQDNLRHASRWTYWIATRYDCVPNATWIVYAPYLDEPASGVSRARAMRCCCEAVAKCDYLVLCGESVQHGGRREAAVAHSIIDLVASFGLRLPVVGLPETIDLGGLDLTLAIHTYLLSELDRSTEPQQLIRDKVARGELGAKAGKGFYDWPPGRAARVRGERDEALLETVQIVEPVERDPRRGRRPGGGAVSLRAERRAQALDGGRQDVRLVCPALVGEAE